MLLGAVTGAAFLGAGGRLIMRLFAFATARPAAFTLRGTLNVTLAGATAGVVGALLLLAVQRFLPTKLWLRALVFAVLCYVLAIPGFRPPVALVFALFAPAFLAYGFTLVMFDRRFRKAAV